MPVKSKTKTIEFGKQDEGFIKQLAKDIGCYYSKMNERTYNLNKFDSDIRNEMGIFAWVHKEETDCFWISTRKVWVEEEQGPQVNPDRAKLHHWETAWYQNQHTPLSRFRCCATIDEISSRSVSEIAMNLTPIP